MSLLVVKSQLIDTGIGDMKEDENQDKTWSETYHCLKSILKKAGHCYP